jgi:serine/threonine protein kinase
MSESLGPLEGKYEIIEAIGEGGMGSVFKVRHKILDEIRVAKVMRSHLVHEEDSKERFYREARIAAKARHRSIAQIFDFSVDEGVAFIIMEYIDGVTLQKALVDMHSFSVPLALEVAQQSLHALALIHRLGIIHRDISPDNLMLTTDSDGNPRIKLIDLGLAKFTEVDSGLTKEGLFLGKLRYASPEQFQTLQGGELGPWSDVYSFGLVIYEVLTGHYPIKGRTLAEMMVGHVSEPPMSFTDSDPEGMVPLDLRKAVLRALAKKPIERFQDGQEFRDQILVIQKGFPFGAEGKEEANRARQLHRSKPDSPAGRTSDQKRLARAFGAGESSAGKAASGVGSSDDGLSDETELRPVSGAEAGRADGASYAAPASPSDPPEGVGSGQEDQAGRGSGQRPPAVQPDIAKDFDPPTLPLKQQRKHEEGASGKAATFDSVDQQPSPVQGSRRDWIVAAVLGFCVLVIAGGIFFRLIPVPFVGGRSHEPVRTGPVGTLVINAVPWAQIVEIQNSEGERIDLEGAEYTPLVLSLPPGSYHVVLRSGEFGERSIDATVKTGETAAEWVPFAEIGEDDLLRSLRLVD